MAGYIFFSTNFLKKMEFLCAKLVIIDKIIKINLCFNVYDVTQKRIT